MSEKIELTELNTAPVLKIMAEGSRDTLFSIITVRNIFALELTIYPLTFTRNSPIGACNYRHFTMQR